MDDITLEKITYKNYIETIWKLKVKRCQKDFVASNNNSLAEEMLAFFNEPIYISPNVYFPFVFVLYIVPHFFRQSQFEAG